LTEHDWRIVHDGPERSRDVTPPMTRILPASGVSDGMAGFSTIPTV
jgi:hypothetical protein